LRTNAVVGIDVDQARSGNGSVHFQSNAFAAKADIEFYPTSFLLLSGGYTGLMSIGSLANLNALSYSYYRDSSTANNVDLSPSLRLWIDADGNTATTSDRGYLIFESTHNNGAATIATNTWITEDVVNYGGLGVGANIWGTGTSLTSPIPTRFQVTLNEWQAGTDNVLGALNTQNAVVLGISSGIGSGWSGIADYAIDNITIGFTGSTTDTYNFEVVPEPSGLILLLASGIFFSGEDDFLIIYLSVLIMLVLPDILTSKELEFVKDELALASFKNGKLTASGAAQRAKNNEQLKRTQDNATDLDAVLMEALTRHSLMNAWAVPSKISVPLINRHAEGMNYGFHVDAAIATQHPIMRRDLSVTVFLSDPESYEGGELEVESPGGLRRIKLPAGHGFIYATNAIHQVCKVAKGVRNAAVFWLQSLIADDQMRQSLFELQAANSSLVERGFEGQEMLLLTKVHQNLTRKFSQP
jgi:PKHD-type hydroxylase